MDGYQIEISGNRFEIFGKVLLCTGDTLGQHLSGGFKEGVGFAFQKCRSCLYNFNEMQQSFDENGFVMRTKYSYERHCLDIANAPNEQVKANLRITYEINLQSPFCALPTFDVTKHLTQDIIHTLLEGAVQYEARLVLLLYVRNGTLTLDRISGTILSHPYGSSETSNKPGPIRKSVFSSEEVSSLKFDALQARLFLRLLPFFKGFSQEYTFLTELIHIVQVIYSPVISTKTIQDLKFLIENHLKKFKELFPDKNVIPKQHYLIHTPEMIKLLGPMFRSSWSSFEAAITRMKFFWCCIREF